MPALEKSTRRKIFYGMILVFALAAPAILLYSRGYVFDFQNLGLVSTGGIFVKTLQPGVRVFVDSEFSRETSFISRGALITGLMPKRYALRVEKEGFRPWQKVVRVSDEEVVEFRNVFLPPATITPGVMFNIRKNQPARLAALAGRTDIGLEVGNPAKPLTVLIVNPATRLAHTSLIKVSRWLWDENSQTFVIGRISDGRMQWFRLVASDDASAREEPVTFRGLPPGFTADGVIPHPAESDQFYFSAGGALFLQGRANVPIPIAEQIHTYAISPKRIYFISKNGFFAESDLNGRDTRILGRKGLFLDEEAPAKIIVSPSGDVAVLDAAAGLFLYQPDRDQELAMISSNVAGIDFDAKAERMLIWDEHRLWIYWLKDNPEQPFDLARSKKQVFYSDGKIQRAFLNDQGTHIFFSTASSIRMTEVDDRASVNSYELVNPHTRKEQGVGVKAGIDGFLLEKKNLTLYWLEDSKLFRADLK